jgi:hypothetical protein
MSHEKAEEAENFDGSPLLLLPPREKIPKDFFTQSSRETVQQRNRVVSAALSLCCSA